MTKLTVTPDFGEQLKQATAEVELCDESGSTFGLFLPLDVYRRLLLELDECPYTEEELARFEQETEVRELADLWKHLNAK